MIHATGPQPVLPVSTPRAAFAGQKPQAPQFAGKPSGASLWGDVAAMAGLAVAAAAGLKWLSKSAKANSSQQAGQAATAEKPKPAPEPPQIQFTERPDGSLVIKEGRHDFWVKDPAACGEGSLIENAMGEHIMFSQTTGEDGSVQRTVERL